MAAPDVLFLLHKCNFRPLVLMGVEVRCVAGERHQFNINLRSRMSACCGPSLDFLYHGYGVHVLADGVSGCNKEEVPSALERMRQVGAQIATGEGMLFQLRGACFGTYLSTVRRRLRLQRYKLADHEGPEL